MSNLPAARGSAATDPLLPVSGSHAKSLDWLRESRADLAAIDAHSWPRVDTRGVRIIGRSTVAPAPPFVMHRHSGIPRELVREALGRAVRHAGHRIGVRAVLAADRSTYRLLRNEVEGSHFHRHGFTAPCA